MSIFHPYKSQELNELYDAWYALEYDLYSNWDSTFTRMPNSSLSRRVATARFAAQTAKVSTQVLELVHTQATEAAIAKVTEENGPYRMCWIIGWPSRIPEFIQTERGQGAPPAIDAEDVIHEVIDLQHKQTYLHLYRHESVPFQLIYGTAYQLIETGEMWERIDPIAPENKPAKLQELIDQLRHQDIKVALQALKNLRKYGWLSDKSLEGADLTGINVNDPSAIFREAYLVDAKLTGVNLSQVDLRGAILCGAQLQHCSFKGSKLQYADFTGANMLGTDLSGADLRASIFLDVDLEAAILDGADLSDGLLNMCSIVRANLDNINLSRVDMLGTYLRNVSLQNAIMNGTQCGGTTFANIDLSVVHGLDSVQHRAPSHLTMDTVFQSKGKLPKVFLRGCSVPEDMINFLHARSNVAKFHSCFISYSHYNEDFATVLYTRLQNASVTVFYAPDVIQGGKKIHEQIYEAIEASDRLLLILSDESINSEWVRTEIRRAQKLALEKKRQKLFPIRLTNMETLKNWQCFDADIGKDLAIEVREYFIPDFTQWKNPEAFEINFQRLLRDLTDTETRE